MIRLFIFLAAVIIVKANASDSALLDPVEQSRYKQLTLELRCPKCQNQDLADSNAPIAADLRNQIGLMIQQGKSDQEIINYMVDRYGEFVLYKPRFAGYNVILWLLPLLFVCLGLSVVGVMVWGNTKKSKMAPLDHVEKQQKLQKLLVEQDKK